MRREAARRIAREYKQALDWGQADAALPSNSIGTLNLACVAGLALFGVGKEQAVPFSWFFWAGQWMPVTLTGLLFLRREGLSLHAITHVQEAPAD